MLPQHLHDSGLRGFNSSRHDGHQHHTQDAPYLAPDGIQHRGERASGAASRRRAPPQYAYPVRVNSSPCIKEDDYSSSACHSAQCANLEHMLRRKTPNGTLAAGYDGAPAHLSTNQPPQKHVVLPIAHRFAQLQNGRGGMRASVQRSYSDNTPWQPYPTPWKVKSESENDKQLPMMDLDEQRMHGSVCVGGHNFEHHGHEVPSVLQPPYQPSLGPTASNDTDTYGPYYANGRTQAYRPAAVRDTAVHPFNPCPGSIYATPSDDDDYFGAPRNWSSNGVRPMILGSHNERRLADTCMRTMGHELNGKSLPMRPTQQSSSLQFVPAQVLQNHHESFFHRNENAQFKERMLGWAHGIYVELLASIYKTKREAHQARKKHGIHRSYSQTSIFPLPPQRTAFLMRRPSDPAYSSDGVFKHTFNGHRYSPTRLQDADIRRRRSNSIVGIMEDKRSYASRMSPSGRGVESYFVPSHQHGSHSQSPLSLYLHTTSPAPGNLRDSAKSALEMLETLCHESGWQWVDGMLLGGCLAYGLGEFERALDWYSKILFLDPSHVEAISNLAATLLSLNRKEEAELHWLRAVKLRPCYFEAVEHLIALLCGDHRPGEAIKIIDFVERSLRVQASESFERASWTSDGSGDERRSSTNTVYAASDNAMFDFDVNSCGDGFRSPIEDDGSRQPGFGSSGYAIPGSDNYRMLALVHAKGNMMYAQGDVDGALQAFEDAVLISVGRKPHGIRSLISEVTNVLLSSSRTSSHATSSAFSARVTPLLLPPAKALLTASLVFARDGQLPGSRYISQAAAKSAAITTTSNSLLSLAKIYQDGMSSVAPSTGATNIRQACGTADILALYYLSLSLQPSPSTANNVGILLAGIPGQAAENNTTQNDSKSSPTIPGVTPGSGVALALAYYNYGLNLDPKHAHLYTNLGSLLKDIGQLTAAIKMYEKAVACDGQFDIALANLANAVKDQGRIKDAIVYYRRAVESSPDFAEAVCGLANALNSVCDWKGRGGVVLKQGKYDRWHVKDDGTLLDSRHDGGERGWIQRVVAIVQKQLEDGRSWGQGALLSQGRLTAERATPLKYSEGQTFQILLRQLEIADTGHQWSEEKMERMVSILRSWAGKPLEGIRIVQMVERSIKRAMHRWYQDKYVYHRNLSHSSYARPHIPSSLAIPGAPTVLPFHTFTCPLSAKQIRTISQRNALRISCSTLRAPWLPATVYPPPPPPAPHLNVGYVSSDFNNHPLAHLMQSVFGMHDTSRAKAFCYATTASDKSAHRQQIEKEAPEFRDASSWSAGRLIQEILKDEIHILINLNGYTRGAKNEVFAARPVPIQMSFMGFAGTLGAEWCDYLYADKTAIPQTTLRPWRNNVSLEDYYRGDEFADSEDWVYSENVIFSQDTFFCCDHRQSSNDMQLLWPEEQQRKWKMRKELFPDLPESAVILGNFNQLYKIEPTVFRTWLRVLSRVPNAFLWLLRFPDLGETNLRHTASLWVGEEVASRIIFTDVAPKNQHISRARICDLFLDTPECNAHTTAADILWSSTPLLTLPRYDYKMCSRMAASILKGALPKTAEGRRAATELVAADDDQYEEMAVRLASGLTYDQHGRGRGRLNDLRRLLYEHRCASALFDTKRWVRDLERAFEEAWHRWVEGIGGDIYL